MTEIRATHHNFSCDDLIRMQVSQRKVVDKMSYLLFFLFVCLNENATQTTGDCQFQMKSLL